MYLPTEIGHAAWTRLIGRFSRRALEHVEELAIIWSLLVDKDSHQKILALYNLSSNTTTEAISKVHMHMHGQITGFAAVQFCSSVHLVVWSMHVTDLSGC
jgi:hypothetical protein